MRATIGTKDLTRPALQRERRAPAVRAVPARAGDARGDRRSPRSCGSRAARRRSIGLGTVDPRPRAGRHDRDRGRRDAAGARPARTARGAARSGRREADPAGDDRARPGGARLHPHRRRRRAAGGAGVPRPAPGGCRTSSSRLPYADARHHAVRAPRASTRASTRRASRASRSSRPGADAARRRRPTATRGHDRRDRRRTYGRGTGPTGSVAWPVPGTPRAPPTSPRSDARGRCCSPPTTCGHGRPSAAGPLARDRPARRCSCPTRHGVLLAAAPRAPSGRAGGAALATLTGAARHRGRDRRDDRGARDRRPRPADADGLGRVLGLLGGQSWIRSDDARRPGGDGRRRGGAVRPAASVASARVADRPIAARRRARRCSALGKAIVAGRRHGDGAAAARPARHAVRRLARATTRAGGRLPTPSSSGFTRCSAHVQLAEAVAAEPRSAATARCPVYVINSLADARRRWSCTPGSATARCSSPDPGVTVVVPRGRAGHRPSSPSARSGTARTDLDAHA